MDASREMFLFPSSGDDDFAGQDDWEAAVVEAHHESLGNPEADHVASVLGPVLISSRCVQSDTGIVRAGVAALHVLADHGSARGLTVREIADRLRDQFPAAAVRQGLLQCVRNRTVIRVHKGELRFVPTLQAAVSVDLVPKLMSVRGHRLLLDLFSELRAKINAGAAVEEILSILIDLRRRVTIFALDARRVAERGEFEEILAHTELDETEFRRRFREASQAVEAQTELVDALEMLNIAVYDYLDAIKDLTARVLANRVRLSDPRLVSSEEFRRAAKYAGLEQLAAVFDGVLFDVPEVWLDLEAVEQAVEDLVGEGAPARVPEPGLGGRDRSQSTLLDQWRLVADELLGDRGEVDLLDYLLTQPWSGPAVTTAQLRALAAADRRYGLHRTDALVVRKQNYPDHASVVTPTVLSFHGHRESHGQVPGEAVRSTRDE